MEKSGSPSSRYDQARKDPSTSLSDFAKYISSCDQAALRSLLLTSDALHTKYPTLDSDLQLKCKEHELQVLLRLEILRYHKVVRQPFDGQLESDIIPLLQTISILLNPESYGVKVFLEQLVELYKENLKPLLNKLYDALEIQIPTNLIISEKQKASTPKGLTRSASSSSSSSSSTGSIPPKITPLQASTVSNIQKPTPTLQQMAEKARAEKKDLRLHRRPAVPPRLTTVPALYPLLKRSPPTTPLTTTTTTTTTISSIERKRKLGD